jgi:hypothetical protein
MADRHDRQVVAIPLMPPQQARIRALAMNRRCFGGGSRRGQKNLEISAGRRDGGRGRVAGATACTDVKLWRGNTESGRVMAGRLERKYSGEKVGDPNEERKNKAGGEK